MDLLFISAIALFSLLSGLFAKACDKLGAQP